LYKIYTKTDCSYCEKAKQVLAEYEEVNVDNYLDWATMLSELDEQFGVYVKTVPQIIKDGQYIGGYKELMETQC
jgi:glutaredoxin 3